MILFVTTLVIYLPVGIFCGLSSKNLSLKKGRSGREGFLLGFFLNILGLCIIFFLPTKNDFEPKESLIKRMLLGFGRLVIFSVLYQIIFTEYLSLSELKYSIVYPFLKSYTLVIGPIWVLRGNTNFLSLN
tara:strand:- start:251 stop:640 length:390 start_codon:yes stop_codon:yes gene_type:complete